MKKLAALGLMIALMSLLLVGGSTAVANPGNLLANPGFDTGNTSGWTVGGTATSRLRKKGKALSRSVWGLNCLGGIRHVIGQFE